MKVIAYQNNDSEIPVVVSVMVPSPAALRTMTITQIANKDVPTGVPYAIIDSDDVPYESEQARAEWDLPADRFSDGVGA